MKSTEKLDLGSMKPEPGVFLIEASAGTGKTYSIANLYLHFILQEKKIREILVVTFTEAATKELRNRIRENLSVALHILADSKNAKVDPTVLKILDSYEVDGKYQLLENAIINFDQAAIFTIHSFCQRMLQENAFESMSLFNTELNKNPESLITEIIQDFLRRKNYTTSTPCSLTQEDMASLLKSYRGQAIVGNMVPDDLEDIKTQFLNLWKQHGPSLLEELRSSTNISHSAKSPYHADKLESYLPVLTDFEQGLIHQNLYQCLKALSQDTLNNYQLKNKVAPVHDLFAVANRLAPYYSSSIDKVEFLSFFEEQYPKKKSARNLLTFDDLIENLQRILQAENGDGPLHQRIREKYKVALVDEFQDTDPSQYKIFESLFSHPVHSAGHSFYMIGDPKQSIYSFRGADIFAYLKAKHRADRSFTLDTNYRSEEGMVQAVNSFFSLKGTEEAFAFAPTENQEGISFHTVKAGAVELKKDRLIIEGDEQEQKNLQLHWLNTPEMKEQSKTNVLPMVPKAITREIVHLLNLSQDGKAYFAHSDSEKTPLKPGDIAILVNSHNQAADVKKELNNNGIPCVIQKSGNVFDTNEAKSILRFLETVFNPRESTIKPLLLSAFFDFSAAEIKDMDENERFFYLQEFITFRKEWEQQGFLRSFQKFIANHELYTRCIGLDDGERIISNIFQLRELLHQEEISEGLGLAGLIRFLNEKIHSSDKDDERFLQRLETDSQAVQILTIHKSKGLEFPVVFCPYLWANSYDSSHWGKGENHTKGDFSFHDENLDHLFCLDPDTPERDQYRCYWRREKLGEQLRLLYVALTRAANRCYLYWGAIKNEPSVFSYLADPNFKGSQLLSKPAPKLAFEDRKNHWQRTLPEDSSIAFTDIHQQEPDALRFSDQSTLPIQAPDKLHFSFNRWMNSSYSSLTRRHTKIQFTPDQEITKSDDDDTNQDFQEVEAKGFFAFPKGANPGTAIHEMFEHIDFQNSSEWNAVIEQSLIKFRLHTDENSESVLDERIQVCREMIHNVLNAKLAPENFSLSNVTKSQRLDEMAFYFPVKNIDLNRLIAIFEHHYRGTKNAEFSEDLKSLTYLMESGFLNGSIDLAFEQNGKYYVLDWKSNHLGNDHENYHHQTLRNAVREKLYFVQYHIYTVALHLFLKNNLENYSYETHFGGVFYAFVRGFKPGTPFGIFHDRLPEGLVNDMESLFLKGNLS
jgi:exodeoxyribonuclease V beta subunit